MATGQAILGGDQLDGGGWQEVRRKRPYPANWRLSNPSPPVAKPYIPYSKTYAQVVRSSPQPPKPNRSQPIIKHQPSQPSSPTSSASTIYYVSPHSPSRLRFPPSHTFPEWKGRCFRCCRTGHAAAKCRNPKRCGRCWAYGHIGSACKQDIVAPPPPVKPVTVPVNMKCEPDFEILLQGSYPYRAPEMPTERPLSLHCFIERDQEYFAELDRLRQAVVMYTTGYQWDLSVDTAAILACRTKLVNMEEISVSQMSGSRFLIVLPEGLHPDTFINATPKELWDEGITFQQWTPLEDASISIPAYKVLLRLVGFPPHLCPDKYVRQAIARFGVFLGSVEPDNPSSIASRLVAIGVDDLTLVPPQLVVHIGGMLYYPQVYVEAWHRQPIYTSDEMPKHPKIYRRPVPPPPSSTSSEDGPMLDDQELIPMSSQVLREMCRGRTADSLPPELRRFATMEEIEMPSSEFPTPAAATMDPQPENQPQNQQLIITPHIQESISQMAHALTTQPHASLSVADQNRGPLTHENVAHGEASHNKSDTTVPQLHPISIPPVSASTLLKENVAGKSQHNTDPSVGGKRRIQPQRILSRGESSVLLANQRIKDQIPRSMPSIQGNNSKFIGGAQITENITPPISQETPVPRALDPKKNLSKPKGLPCGPTKGPLASKYKWTKPVTRPNPNSNIVLQQVKETQCPKRKNALPLITKPPKRAAGKEKVKDQALISFNPEGFYEVEVQYDHITKLASGCGFKNSDLEDAIAKDNEQRRIQALHNDPSSSEKVTAENLELDMGRFDPDPEDELTSDEED